MKDLGYPKSVELGALSVLLREMRGADEKDMLDFARGLPTHDLLFLRRDITNPKVVSAWVEAIRAGTIWTVLALDGETILGCAALIRDPLSWSPQLGELRVLVAPAARDRGLGRLLIQEAFRKALRLNLRKLTAMMTVDQKGAIAIFEELGFRGEGLLKDHVIDRDGVAHDIVMLSHDVARGESQLAAFGVGETQ
ncbi:MAG: GNAT family N-acetyltransferase [Parvularculaceae bacterium]|jgi:L-amino acid N-acyltransferase YncA|nr:GNAT family N-acetyltransferase [Parvularculaceae bacterium]